MSKLPIIVSPSVLAADLGNMTSEIRDVESAGADWLHIDVMDGSFVPPITFGDNLVKLAKKSCSLFIDSHLMITEPWKQIRSFADSGSSLLTVHHEACPDPASVMKEIRASGMKSGISVKPATSESEIFSYLDLCDLVLIMTVNPGWTGQKFMPECLPKIGRLKAEIDRRKLNTAIQVDGGINLETAALCRQAGANVFVAGVHVFRSGDRARAIRDLKALG